MQFGMIKGSVTATVKTKEMHGLTLKLMVPCNEKKEIIGDHFVAIDPIGARVGDFVMWVGKREASLAIPGTPLANNYPVDAAVTGIIDDLS